MCQKNRKGIVNFKAGIYTSRYFPLPVLICDTSHIGLLKFLRSDFKKAKSDAKIQMFLAPELIFSQTLKVKNNSL